MEQLPSYLNDNSSRLVSIRRGQVIYFLSYLFTETFHDEKGILVQVQIEGWDYLETWIIYICIVFLILRLIESQKLWGFQTKFS